MCKQKSRLTAVQTNRSGLLPRTTWCKTDHYYNKDFSSSPYLQTDLHFLGQHWRVSSVLALMLGPSQLPDPMAVHGGLRHHRLAAPGPQGGAGSCGGSWGSAGHWGWSCWRELSVWWSPSQALCQSPGRGQTCSSEVRPLQALVRLRRARRRRACSCREAAGPGWWAQGQAFPPG